MNDVYITSNASKSKYFIEILINSSKLDTRYITLNGGKRNHFNRITSILNRDFILKIIEIKHLYYDE